MMMPSNSQNNSAQKYTNQKHNRNKGSLYEGNTSQHKTSKFGMVYQPDANAVSRVKLEYNMMSPNVNLGNDEPSARITNRNGISA